MEEILRNTRGWRLVSWLILLYISIMQIVQALSLLNKKNVENATFLTNDGAALMVSLIKEGFFYSIGFMVCYVFFVGAKKDPFEKKLNRFGIALWMIVWGVWMFQDIFNVLILSFSFSVYLWSAALAIAVIMIAALTEFSIKIIKM